jgi:hypothetical protein
VSWKNTLKGRHDGRHLFNLCLMFKFFSSSNTLFSIIYLFSRKHGFYTRCYLNHSEHCLNSRFFQYNYKCVPLHMQISTILNQKISHHYSFLKITKAISSRLISVHVLLFATIKKNPPRSYTLIVR